ncbi:hypothetical protein AB6735_22135 [Mucilaginibacter sp. RCC_168]|uniref:hypothetical protein n=1 Tax=Mucilaginibacter sp. RCC_168 TaxID=3239221 RepID=UPI0035253294
MLTLDDFNTLNEFEQAEAIWQGTFLADREENGLIVRLYSLNNFYAEVFYDAHVNKILRLTAFDKITQLGPYFAHIKFNKG